MKILTFILSIFILTIAVLPCEDDNDISFIEIGSSYHVDDQSHNHSEHNEGGCSNFCLCQCCGTPITIPSLSLFGEIKNNVLHTYSFHYSSLYSFDYSDGVWHPPTQC